MLILCFWYKPHSPPKAEHDFFWYQQKLCWGIKGRTDCVPTGMSRVGRANFGSRWENSEPAWLEAAIRMSENSCILSKCLKDPSPWCDTGCLQVTLASCNLQYYAFANNTDTCFFVCFVFLKKEKSQRSTRLIDGSRKSWRCRVARSVCGSP